ncbi:DUF3048 domain-containing protein [uncultured Friedmanniella sp.]|uniref:DUF3048 domain-containing protein n=1 Tax=uncultured Friedmanniella sp. TaxID=335381 RepID=UPI0035C94D2E
MLAAGAVVLVLAGGGVALAAGGGSDHPAAGSTASTAPSGTPSSPPKPTPEATPKPKPKPTDPLTGGKVDSGEVLAVKVENIGLARPQVGLNQADIVFAEQVEGAQTRLVAVYHTRFPKRLGPVRSARSTDAQLLPLFGRPGLVYSGANTKVQRTIDKASILPIFVDRRDQRRVAPHNVFVDLRSIAARKKAGAARSIGWTFAAGTPSGGRKEQHPTSKVGHDTFRFDYASGRYTVRWNGQRYVDGDSGAVTRADNVVVLHVHDHADGNHDVLGSASVMSDTVGEGAVSVYRDGRRFRGTWSRSSAGAVMRLRDRDGRDIPLAPGQTWVTLQG